MDKGRYSTGAVPIVVEAEEEEEEESEGGATAAAPTGDRAFEVAAPTPLGGTVDLEDAVLAALCEDRLSPMKALEVQSRSVKYLGVKPSLPAVIIALNLNPKVKQVDGDSFRGDCT